MISRRALLALPLAVACGTRRSTGFRGYAFIANRDGKSIAAVDLQVMAVARHIPLDGSPAQVLASGEQPLVYALAPESGAIYEIQVDRLGFSRKTVVATKATSMRLTRDSRTIYVLASEPKALVRLALDSFRVEWRIPLPEDPIDFAITQDGRIAAITSASGVRLVNLAARGVSTPLMNAEFGGVHFLRDTRTLLAANRGQRQLAIFDTASARLITNLPLAVSPDHMCFKPDGGQLFITGEGMDAVVIVFPDRTPEVFQTVLAGHSLGPMAASQSFLFIASPEAGNVSIFDINLERVIATVGVGSDPGFIAVTPDDQLALVLNRKSGDVAVLRIGSIQPNRYKTASLLTVIPVGSQPVSAAVRAV